MCLRCFPGYTTAMIWMKIGMKIDEIEDPGSNIGYIKKKIVEIEDVSFYEKSKLLNLINFGNYS